MKEDRWKKTMLGLLLLVPAFIILYLFSFRPLFSSFYLSLQGGNIFMGGMSFVGLENYLALFQDRLFLKSLTNTFIYTFFTTVPSMILGYLSAVLLEKNLKGIRFFRSLFFAPLMSSIVAISAVWIWIYHPDYGILNGFLDIFNTGPFRWLTDSSTALLSLVIMGIWKNLGLCCVLYLGALQNISNEVIEAALIDGTSESRIIRKIKLPLVSPTTFMLAILLTTRGFQTFSEVNVMTGGGPNNSTKLLVPLLYEQAFTYQNYGYSSTIAMVLFVGVLLLTLLQNYLLRKKVFYQ